MKQIWKSFKTAILFSVCMILLCGVVYPVTLTVVSQFLFPKQANNSLVEVNGIAIGSELVGQDFDDARLFHCRPSAYNYNTYTQEDVAEGTYNGLASGSNNYAPSNPALAQRIQEDIAAFQKENPEIELSQIPSDLITASGSGLDPHISIQAAQVQIPRIAKATNISETELNELVEAHKEGKVLGIFGEEKVNVLRLNLAVAQKIGMI